MSSTAKREAAGEPAASQTSPGAVTRSTTPRPADAIDFPSLRRVLVVMLRHHGDVLLTSPVFRALRGAAPGAEIDALIYRETAPMLAGNPDVARVHMIDRAWKKAGAWRHLQAERRLLAVLKDRRFDLVVHLTGHRRGAWLVRALGPRHSVAPRLPDESGLAGRFWTSTFTHRYANGSSMPSGAALGRRHTVEQNLDALRRLGLVIPTPPALTMVPGPDAEREAAALLARLAVDGPFVAMQPTSRWAFKCWPVQTNAALVATLLQRGERVLLSCAPDARERAMIDAIVAAVTAMRGVPAHRLAVADDGSLQRLAALIGRARLFVGIDSAPMHIAAAMGTPTVALFGPSGEFNWGPWKVAHRVVVSDAFPCRPCGQDGCGGGKVSECLVQIPVSRVLAAIDQLTSQRFRQDALANDPLAFA